MVAIAGCESNYVHYKPGGGVIRGRVDSRDTGAFQINSYYHPDVDSEDFWENITYARELYDEQGDTPWVCRNHIAQL
jgi:hypothetical protein